MQTRSIKTLALQDKPWEPTVNAGEIQCRRCVKNSKLKELTSIKTYAKSRNLANHSHYACNQPTIGNFDETSQLKSSFCICGHWMETPIETQCQRRNEKRVTS
jgi:hypothetical protein